MASHLSEEELWATDLAARLKLLQANCADQPAADRETHLTEEVERALKDVIPSKRDAYLKVLGERFPAWQTIKVTQVVESGGESMSEDPEVLLEQLIQSTAGLPAEAKAGYIKKLQAAGFPVPQGGSAPLEASPEVREQIGLTAEQQLDAERVLQMATGLTQLVKALDQLVWTLWKQLAPRSTFRKETEFAKMVGPFLGGDPEVTTKVLGQPLERTRKLIAALLGSVGRAGSTYAKQHTSRFAPEVIEDFANMEKKWTESIEVVCWRKYREHYKEHSTEPSIENEIQDAIVKATENLIMGRVAG